MPTMDELPGEKLAALLDPYQFEMLIRARARMELARLSEVTEGGSSYNCLTFTFTSSGGKWKVGCGRNYDTFHSAEGEVLSATTDVAVVHQQMLGRTKLALLAPPEGTSDDEILF